MIETQTIDVFGVDELNEFFATLARTDQKRVILDSFRKGGEPLIQAAKSLLKAKMDVKPNGNLMKSFGFVPMAGRRNSVFVSGKIGARKFGVYKGNHGHWFNNGTSQRVTDGKKSMPPGLKRGFIKGNRYWDEALQATENQMIDNSQQYMLEALEKLITKTLPKRNQL